MAHIKRNSASHLSLDSSVNGNCSTPTGTMIKSLLKSPVQAVRRLSPSLRRRPKRHVQRDVVVVQGADSDNEDHDQVVDVDFPNSPVASSDSLIVTPQAPSRSRSVATPIGTSNPNLLSPDANLRRNHSATESANSYHTNKADRQKLHKFRTLRRPEGATTTTPTSQNRTTDSFDCSPPASPHMRSLHSSNDQMLDTPQLVGGVQRKMRRPLASDVSDSSFLHSPASSSMSLSPASSNRATLSASSELSQFALDRQNSIKRMRSRKKSLNEQQDQAQVDAVESLQNQRV